MPKDKVIEAMEDFIDWQMERYEKEYREHLTFEEFLVYLGLLERRED